MNITLKERDPTSLQQTIMGGPDYSSAKKTDAHHQKERKKKNPRYGMDKVLRKSWEHSKLAQKKDLVSQESKTGVKGMS